MEVKILIVEDDQEMRLFIADILKGAGYQVTTPVDGYVALEMAEGNAYDLITLDEKSPLIDSKAFAQALRDAHNRTPILLLSDALNDQNRKSFQELGIQEFILKPFQVDHLLDHVRNILPATA